MFTPCACATDLFQVQYDEVCGHDIRVPSMNCAMTCKVCPKMVRPHLAFELKKIQPSFSDLLPIQL